MVNEATLSLPDGTCRGSPPAAAAAPAGPRPRAAAAGQRRGPAHLLRLIAAAGRGIAGGPCNTTRQPESRLRLLIVLPSAPPPEDRRGRHRPWGQGSRSTAPDTAAPRARAGRSARGSLDAASVAQPLSRTPRPELRAPRRQLRPVPPCPAPFPAGAAAAGRACPRPRGTAAPPRGSPSANGDNKVFGTSCGPVCWGRGRRRPGNHPGAAAAAPPAAPTGGERVPADLSG